MRLENRDSAANGRFKKAVVRPESPFTLRQAQGERKIVNSTVLRSPPPRSDLPGKPYEIVKEGTLAEVPPERAAHYIKLGVAEAST